MRKRRRNRHAQMLLPHSSVSEGIGGSSGRSSANICMGRWSSHSERGRPKYWSIATSNRVMAPTQTGRQVRAAPWHEHCPMSDRGCRRRKAGCLFAPVGTIRYRRPSRNATVVKNSRASSGPWYSRGSGGILTHTSSVISSTSRLTSPAPNAFVSRSTSSRCSSVGVSRSGSVPPAQLRGERGPGPLEHAVHRLFARLDDLSPPHRGTSRTSSGAPARPVGGAAGSGGPSERPTRWPHESL